MRRISEQNEKSFKGVLKTKKKKNMKRLSFITQFKIEFLLRLPVVVVEKCLEKCLGIEIFDIYQMKGLDLFLDPQQLPEGSCKIGSVRPSVCPSICLAGVFLGIVQLIFSKFWHGARIPCEVVPPKWAKNGFFNLLKNLVLNFY